MWHHFPYCICSSIDSLKLSAAKKFMKQKWMLLLAGMLIISGIASAQVVTADAIAALKKDNELLKMAISINDQKLELAKLQNQLMEKNSNVEKTADASQKAADNNQEAAAVLVNDDQDKAKASAAKKSANTADKNASKARKAEDKLGDLNKDIEKLKKQIAESEQKLSGMGGAQYLHASN
jgi:Mg2+ and Co2+ transporter CorA